MDSCSKTQVAREFADQLQVSTPRLTTRDYSRDYRFERLAELRVTAIRDQAAAAAAIYLRRSPAESDDLATLAAELAGLICDYLERASRAEVTVDEEAWLLLATAAEPPGAPDA